MIDIQQVKKDFENGVLISRATWEKVIEAAMQTPSSAHLLTDAGCHEILMAMKEHVQEWTDAQDLDDCDEDNFPAFSGECIRFIAAYLAQKG